MAATAVAGKAALAALYERYELQAYNIAYRITGSEPDAADATQEAFLRTMRRLPQAPDGEAVFGLRFFAATRSACHDLLEKRQPAQPTEAMLDAPRKDIRDANMGLPERQREALAMLALGELSYEEIAASMEVTPDAVAQLISRARLNLSADLHGTALAAVAAPSPECERALPLIAARDDRQLAADGDDGAWLDAHLAGCKRCTLAAKAMHEADASYRAWAPIAVLPWLFEETMEKAAALADVEWSEETAESQPSRRRRATVAAGLAALLLGGGAAVLVAGERPSGADQPVADGHSTKGPTAAKQEKRRGSHKAARAAAAPRATTASSTASVTEAGGKPSSEPAASPADHQGASSLQPQEATSAPEPKQPPAPSPPSQPAPASPAATQPTTEAPAPSNGGSPLDEILPSVPKP